MAGMIAGGILSGLGGGISSYFEMQQQKELLDMKNQNNLQLAQMGFDNQLLLQQRYQDWQNQFLQQKQSFQIEQMNKQAQLRGMNTPSALMNAHVNSSVTSSVPVSTQYPRSHWVNDEGQTNQSTSANINMNPQEAGVGTSDTTPGKELSPTPPDQLANKKSTKYVDIDFNNTPTSSLPKQSQSVSTDTSVPIDGSVDSDTDT